MENSSPILNIQDVVKHFGNLIVLDGVSFSVNEGEILGIAGPNGAGKTTLFNLISGALPLTTGNMFFRGAKITNLKPHRVCSLGISRTFQTPVVFPTLTVRDNIRVGAIFGNAGLPKKPIGHLVDEILNLMGLGHINELLAENLSLYEKKLVMLGAALATEPKLILLDEPAAGLPHGEIENFMNIILKIKQERGLTILIIEHLIDWLRDVSEKMLIIHNGAVMAYGPPEEVVKDDSVIDIYLGKEPDES
jgi:branched-chain amino acid transport system ATP-binding protein